jgi:flagellar basal body-associated protein FliL
MKNIRTSISNWAERLEDRWVTTPRKDQRKIILHCFIVYILITAVAIVQLWYEVHKSKKDIQMEHISPLPKNKVPVVVPFNKIINNFKTKGYERK